MPHKTIHTPGKMLTFEPTTVARLSWEVLKDPHVWATLYTSALLKP
jgi:hypothetical protein